MVNFVLMLTERDVTIPDALQVYRDLVADELRTIAVKDVGADPEMIRELTRAAHEDGRSVLLELADMSEKGQERGYELALDLGVDQVVGAWSPRAAEALSGPGAPQYWPFAGQMSGSPLVLTGTPEQLSADARRLSAAPAVAGLVLMPYRQSTYPPRELLRQTVDASGVPVLVAGGVRGAEQIADIAAAGAWGFTMGGAALADRHDDPKSVSERVNEVLRLCREASGQLVIEEVK
ncbi:hypothetical protein Acy02nite_89060 [Actinoplanes cyaneus]|uniref:Uncharacterized protein n=1 Tax=Actinoplanes cyaneus TaxID=52696 RepID=A0A919IRR5_9ACTN|nr:hypothetical protein [Actinoplanes cyaneus]MCW2144262.1 hypothetical protein [Actinoplanes cyaneus]GID71025.1 hypothetical protein Acy02nite_89060 [Actinoplanes cyaneus]